MIALLNCPACGGSAATPVFEFNGLVLLDYMRDSPLSRYEYRLCHACGLVYAAQRPEGEELTFLYSRFDEFLGREDKRAPYDASGIRHRLAHGWLSTEEQGAGRDELVQKIFNKQMSESQHVAILAARVPIRGMRILERFRATTGLMLDLFRRFFGAAEVYAMPISEHYRTVIDTLNPMDTAIIDFDRLDIPFHGPFDLVVTRHVLTHALRLDRLCQTLHRIVAPSGWLYLQLENDDATMFGRRKNLFDEMKCFHFQNFDVDTLGRLLRWQGFEPDFIRHPRRGRSELMCLARRLDAPRPGLIAPAELDARIRMYQEWRDRSVLSAPASVRGLVGPDLPLLEARAISLGYGARNQKGRVTAVQPLRAVRENDYAVNDDTAGE